MKTIKVFLISAVTCNALVLAAAQYQQFALFPLTLGSSWTYDDSGIALVSAATEMNGVLSVVITNKNTTPHGRGSLGLVADSSQVMLGSGSYGSANYIIFDGDMGYYPLVKTPMSLGQSWTSYWNANGYPAYQTSTVTDTNKPVKILGNVFPNCTELTVVTSFPQGYTPGQTRWVSNYYYFLPEVGCIKRILTSDNHQTNTVQAVSWDIKDSATPVVISQQPPDRTVAAGGTAVFSVLAYGTAALKYQWRMNGSNLPGATKSTCTLANVKVGSAGNYSVMVSNVYGSLLSSNATLIVTPPVDTRPPTLAITNGPAAGAKLTNALVSLSGTAQDDVGIHSVEYRLDNRAGIGSWLPALGTTGWSVTLNNLVVGTNTLRVRARDTAGNVSAETKRTWTLLAPLTISVNGCGSLQPNYAGTTFQELGKVVSITAKSCNSSNLFAGWSGGLATNSPTIRFVMPSNLVLQANFVSNRFISAKGTFNGLFYEADRVRLEAAGFVTLMLTEAGAYSGSLQIKERRYALSGKFGLDGGATNLLTQAKTNTILVQMSLHEPDGLTGTVSGSISNQVWVANLIADRAVFDARKRPADYAGRYTLIIPGTNGSATLPMGAGCGSVTVSAGGSISFAATLADGTKVSQSVPVSAQGQWPLYTSLYSGQGALLGWVGFTNTAGLGGDLVWIKPPLKTAYYPNGFSWMTEARGGGYVAPPNGLNVFGSTNSRLVLVLDGGNLAGPITNSFTLDGRNQVKNPSLTNKLTLTFTTSSGLFSGSQNVPGIKSSIILSGAIMQNRTNGGGYFLGTNQSGSVILRPE